MKGLLIAAFSVVAALAHGAGIGAAQTTSINVRDFGAIGDGVHDDTLALQKAADAVYPGERVQDRDYATMRSRFRTDLYIEHGPVREVFFPAGVYRITGPVMFANPVVLRGEGGAVVRNDSPEEDSFYLHRALYARVEGLTFDGGRVQMRVWNRNCAGPIVVDGCTFRNASRVGFMLDSLVLTEAALKGDPTANKYDCSPYVVTRLPDGRVSLADRDPKTCKKGYSSALLLVDRCLFEGNACALDIVSDGEIVRDCIVRVPRSAAGAAIRTESKTLLQNVKVFVERNPEIEQYAFDAKNLFTTIQDCEVRSDGDLTAIRSEGWGFRAILFTRLAIRNLALDTGSAPVIRFEKVKFPSLVSIRGLRSLRPPKERKRVFDFEQVPDAAEVEGWQRANRAVSQIQARLLETPRSWAIQLAGIDPSFFRAGLPDSLKPFVRTAPKGVYSADTERFTQFADENWGAEFRDETIGSELASKPNDADDENLHRLFAQAAKSANGKPYTVVLPPRWICAKRAIELSGKVRVISRGVAVLSGTDAEPIFRVRQDADVLFENIHFRGGKNVLEANVGKGLARFYHCEFFDQAETCVKSIWGKGDSRMRIEISGGDATCHSTYRGNANPMLFDCTEFNPGLGVPMRGQECRDYCNLENLAGGRLILRHTISSPMCFEYVWPMSKINRDPTPEQIGDFRWIDNWGRLETFDARFGGEWGGLTTVYQKGPGASASIEGGYAWVYCNRLRVPRMHVIADSPDARAVFAEVGTAEFRNRTPARAVCLKERGAPEEIPLRQFLSYPFAEPPGRLTDDGLQPVEGQMSINLLNGRK